MYQQTLKERIVLTGIGLHSGQPVTLTIRPADPGTGIVFHRTDMTPAVTIEACAASVVSTRLSTTIGSGGASVATIEHLMAALRGCGIDNAHLDIDGPEVPIMDGSALPFVTAIQAAGVRRQARPRSCILVKKPVTIIDGDKKISIVPSRYFRISFDIRFNHPLIRSQFRSLKFDERLFSGHYAGARTFGFTAEVEMLKAHGLARGASLENAVGIDENGIANPEGLRFPDEFVRHKILDAIGDLSLAGHRLIGHVKAFKSGHDLNHRLVTTLLERQECWELIEQREPAREAALQIFMPGLTWSEA